MEYDKKEWVKPTNPRRVVYGQVNRKQRSLTISSPTLSTFLHCQFTTFSEDDGVDYRKGEEREKSQSVLLKHQSKIELSLEKVE